MKKIVKELRFSLQSAPIEITGIISQLKKRIAALKKG